jgi:hypothetical protein
MSDFWSRRKQAVADAQKAETAAATEARESETLKVERATQDGMTEAELLKHLNLPDPDTIKSGDDVAAFLAKVVPTHIRNRALRSLWRSNPVLACVDGLNDYDGDFTGNGLNGGALKTSHEVGKGMAAHVKRVVTSVSDEKTLENEAQPIEKKLLAEKPVAVKPSECEVAEEEFATLPVMPSPRMRFTFEEESDA